MLLKVAYAAFFIISFLLLRLTVCFLYFPYNLNIRSKSGNYRKMKKKVVIIGAGFGGINVAKVLEKYKGRFEVTLIDKQNHHLFQPMLYQVATGLIPVTNVAVPVRGIINHRYIQFFQDTVESIDESSQKVFCRDRSFDYDYLILATGAKYTYFGHDDWAQFCFSLKTAADALAIKNHLFKQLELAERITSAEDRKKHLRFIIIGGGATGVELAGALADIVNSKMFKNYNYLHKEDVSIDIIEASDKILAAFPEKLAHFAKKSLERKGVSIHLNERVTDIQIQKVLTDRASYDSETIIWSASVVSAGADSWLNADSDRGGRIYVDAYLKIQGRENIFAIGDASHYALQNGLSLPGLAAVAKQQGKYVAQYLYCRIGEKKPKKFKYIDLGIMAIISKKAAIAKLRNLEVKGRVGWLMWGIVHIYFLMSLKNKVAVFCNWCSYFFFKRLGSIVVIERTKPCINNENLKAKESTRGSKRE